MARTTRRVGQKSEDKDAESVAKRDRAAQNDVTGDGTHVMERSGRGKAKSKTPDVRDPRKETPKKKKTKETVRKSPRLSPKRSNARAPSKKQGVVEESDSESDEEDRKSKPQKPEIAKPKFKTPKPPPSKYFNEKPSPKPKKRDDDSDYEPDKEDGGSTSDDSADLDKTPPKMPDLEVDSETFQDSPVAKLATSMGVDDADDEDDDDDKDDEINPLLDCARYIERRNKRKGNKKTDAPAKAAKKTSAKKSSGTYRKSPAKDWQQFWKEGDNERRLCELWEEEKLLYVFGEPNHRNTTVRGAAYARIAKKLGCPSSVVQVRMATLRTEFQKLLRMGKSGTSPKPKTQRKKEIVAMCWFLRDHVKASSSSSNTYIQQERVPCPEDEFLGGEGETPQVVQVGTAESTDPPGGTVEGSDDENDSDGDESDSPQKKSTSSKKRATDDTEPSTSRGKRKRDSDENYYQGDEFPVPDRTEKEKKRKKTQEDDEDDGESPEKKSSGRGKGGTGTGGKKVPAARGTKTSRKALAFDETIGLSDKPVNDMSEQELIDLVGEETFNKVKGRAPKRNAKLDILKDRGSQIEDLVKGVGAIAQSVETATRLNVQERQAAPPPPPTQQRTVAQAWAEMVAMQLDTVTSPLLRGNFIARVQTMLNETLAAEADRLAAQAQDQENN